MFFDDIEDEEDDVRSVKSSVKLNPYKEREFKSFEVMTESEIVSGAGGYLVGDIEVYSNYFLIAFKCVASNKVILFEKSDTQSFDIRKLFWIMHNYTTIGFNWLKFDLPLLWYAHRDASLEQLKELTRQLIEDKIQPREFERGYNIKIPKTNCIDLMEVCPLKGSLKTYGARLHCERLQDLPFDPDKVLTDAEIRVVRSYCINDLDITLLLFTALLDQFKLRDELSVQYRENLMSQSDAQIAEAVLVAELTRITGHRPHKAKIEAGRVFNYKPPKWMQFSTPLLQNALSTIAAAEYIVKENGRVVLPTEVKSLHLPIGNNVYKMGNGGLHSTEKSICHVGSDEVLLLDRDVASYYPSIILNGELYPESLGKSFLEVYRLIYDRRLKAKKDKNHSVDSSLKIVLNGSFGKFGSPYSVLYAPDLMIQVTLTGQLALLMLIERLEAVGISATSANTDGVVMKCPKDRQEAALAVISEWERATGFKTEETPYTAVYSRDVNAYIAVKPDGTCKGKNAYFDPWSGGAKAAIFRFHKNPRTTICIEAVNAFLTVGTPIEETIANCKDIKKFASVQNVKGGAHKNGDYLGKVVRWYYAESERGTINYVSNNNKVPDTEGALPMMDLPKHFPNNVDLGWYVRKAKQMLIDIGHTKLPGERSFFD